MIRPRPRCDSAVSARGLAAAACLFGVTAVFGLLGGTSRVARADGDELATSPSPEPPTAGSSAAPVSAEALGRAKEASERLTRLRAAGDEDTPS